MANTLTGLIPTLFAALDVVSRELVGFIPAVTRNSSAERAALNETITYPVAPIGTLSNITPGVTAPNDGDQTIGTGSITISKSMYAPVRWNGEEMKGVGNSGQLQQIMQDQFSNAMRALVNQVETDLAVAARAGASRAVGTIGQNPFGTAGDFSDFAAALKVLDDNGAPTSDRHLVLGSAAIANLRGKQSVLFKVNEAGTQDLLRAGIMGRVEGFDIHNSAGIKQAASGGGTAYVTNGSTAPGVTGIALITGSGTVLAGDVVTFAADATNKYVIGTGVAAPGTIQLNKPGALVTIATSNAMTIAAANTANAAFSRNAIHLVTRAPAMPEGGDGADDVMEITDPVSGLSFQVAVYRQYRQIRYEVGLAWGVATPKSEHIATLIGA
jgi:hypothetical protein